MSPVSQSAVGSERLAWAIFMAAAAHGLFILGVGFSPPPLDPSAEAPTLEVTLLDAPVADQPVPEDARYLAQASQDGAGNVEEQVRPEFFDTLPTPSEPDALLAPLPEEATEHFPGEPEVYAPDMVASWDGAMLAAVAPPFSEPEIVPAAPPPEGGITRVTATGRLEYFVSVSAQESVFAEYLAAWKARMERLGTLNFPNVTRDQRSGNPVLEVAVAADGTLEDVRVTQSSGHSALDQAAVELVRLASPFDAFPFLVRTRYDVLRFAYEWRFIDGQASPGELRAAPR